MRIVITEMITLDGRIEMLGDWFNPGDQDQGRLDLMAEQGRREDVLLLAAQLVDEVRLFTFPVWQGGGRGLVPDGTEDLRLRRVDHRVLGNGLTYAAYEPS